MKRCLFIFTLLLLLTALNGYSQQFDRKGIEKTTSKAIEKAYAASVRIWGYDTVKRQQNSSQFSGVVVSADGHILTVAHATIPGNTYKVIFPDGKECIAFSLGRIGFSEKQNMPDVAMMKILSKGVWPFAQMGWSGSLKVNEPCISISYPETLNQPLPNVRFGRISVPLTEWGFVESTCKMEPGDSGGPLFDYMGRVIAMHSRIDQPEEANYEVPIDLYRKYWTALNLAVDYKELPKQEDTFKPDPLAHKILTIAALENMDPQFEQQGAKLKGASLLIKSEMAGQMTASPGTLFLFDKVDTKAGVKSGSFLIGKSTLVGSDPVVELAEGETCKAVVVARDRANDLVLLKLESILKAGIKIKSFSDTTALTFNKLGRFLLSPLPSRPARVGVLSSNYFGLPRKFSAGYFGANATFIKQQIIITRITPGSPAALGKLELQDQVTGINGVAISQPPQYGGELMKYAPGETITIQGVRNGVPYNLSVLLASFPSKGHPAEQVTGGKSLRLDDFKKVFAHDAAIQAKECGGPVFDADGVFYGINIARFSRTTTLAVPAAVIFEFIARSI